MGVAEARELTIDELARETGMTVRNIRSHQGRGLLPAPEVRGRTGYYGPEHVARLRLIRDMQAEGFNLRAIERLLAGAGGDGAQLLDFGRAAIEAFSGEEPELTTAEDLVARLGDGLDGRMLARAEKLGLIRPLGDGRFEIPSPTLLRAGEELAGLGVPLSHTLAVAGKVQKHSRAIAEAFVRLFLDDVVGQETEARTPEQWAALREALGRVEPLAGDAVRAIFEHTMSDEVEKELGRRLRR